MGFFRIIFYFWLVLAAQPLLAIASDLEEKEGTLSKIVKHNDSGEIEELYTLEETSASGGYSHLLRFSNPPPTELVNKPVSITGSSNSNFFAVRDIRFAAGSLRSLSGESAVQGNRGILIVRVHYDDVSPTCSDSFLSGMIWTNEFSVANFYETTSGGRLRFPFDTDGDSNPDIIDIHLSKDFASCSPNGDYNAVRQAALDAGVDWNLYWHRYLVFPPDSQCNISSMAVTDCNQYNCRIWISGCPEQRTWIHEMGHNLGLDHARTDLHNDGDIEDEYGDSSTLMGRADLTCRHNAPHQVRLGWIPEDRVVDVSSDGIFEIAAADGIPSEMSPVPPTSIQVLRVNHNRFPDITYFPNPPFYYYISFRRSLDSFSVLDEAYDDKVHIHWWSENTTTAYSNLISTLVVDDKWYDNMAEGISVTVLQVSETHATVRVAFEDYPPITTPTPTPAPTITPSPTETPSEPNTEAPAPTTEVTPTPPTSSARLIFTLRTKWNRRGRRFTLSGRLLRSKSPIANQEVSLYLGQRAEGNRRISFSADDSESKLLSTTTNARGRFRFRGLRKLGTYRAWWSGQWSNRSRVRRER